MASSVDWVFRMIDKVTAPASAAQRRLEAIEKATKRVEAAVRVSGGAFGGWAKQGEHAAQRVERAMGSVQKRWDGMGRRFGNLQNMYWSGMAAAAPLVGVGYAGKQIVDAAAYKQNTLINLRGLLGGDAGKAGKLFDQAQLFAALTPFSTEQVINATSQALAIGFKDRQAIPLVKLAGQLSAGSGKSMDQVMEAFAALRGGDFGQAFGVGQGFSNLKINRDMLRQAGLKFDAQGAYQGNVTQGLAAVAKIIRKTYGTAMDEQGLSLSGLASTLGSRPQELFMSLVDNKGQSRAMKPLQDFMANLAELTDFSKPPGSQIQQRFEKSMIKLFGAVFNPLANATNAKNGPELVRKLLDKVDQFSAWAEAHGPAIVANLKGFGEGFKAAYDGAMLFIKPLGWIVDKLSALTGGSGQGGVGKVLGFLAGGFALGKVGSLLTFGGLGKLGGWGARTAFGALKSGLSNVFLEVMTNPLGKMAGLRAALPWLGRIGGLFARLGPLVLRFLPMLGRVLPTLTGGAGLGGIAAAALRAVPLIGLIISAVIALKGLGDKLYDSYKPFADLVDRIKEPLGFILDPKKATTGWQRAGYWDPIRALTGQPQLYEPGGQGSTQLIWRGPTTAKAKAGMAATVQVAQRMGLDPNKLLPIIFKESSFMSDARNKDSDASGLMQFLPSTLKAYGLTPEKIRAMTPEQQIPYMLRYLKEAGVTSNSTVEQIYSAVFAGNASKAGNLRYTAGTRFYDDNKGMDLNGDKVITSDELAKAAMLAYQQSGYGTFAPSVTVNLNGPTTPEAAQLITDSTSQVLHNYSVEQGYGGQR